MRDMFIELDRPARSAQQTTRSCRCACSRASRWRRALSSSAARAACGRVLGFLAFRLFLSSQHSTKACSGGDRYRPTMSSSFSTNFGSRETLKPHSHPAQRPCCGCSSAWQPWACFGWSAQRGAPRPPYWAVHRAADHARCLPSPTPDSAGANARPAGVQLPAPEQSLCSASPVRPTARCVRARPNAHWSTWSESACQHLPLLVRQHNLRGNSHSCAPHLASIKRGCGGIHLNTLKSDSLDTRSLCQVVSPAGALKSKSCPAMKKAVGVISKISATASFFDSALIEMIARQSLSFWDQ